MERGLAALQQREATPAAIAQVRADNSVGLPEGERFCSGLARLAAIQTPDRRAAAAFRLSDKRVGCSRSADR